MARVLILTLVFPPDGVSTAQIVGDLAADLQAGGHEVVVLTTTPHYNRDPVAEAAQPLRPWWGRALQASSFRGIPVYHARVPRKGRSVAGRLAAWGVFHVMSTLASVGLAGRPDVILVPSPPLTMGLNAWVIARLKRCPFIYNVQELYPDLAITLGAIKSPLLIAMLYRLERFVYSRSAAVTVIASGMRDRIVRKGVPAGRVSVIPNSVDLSELGPMTKDNEFGRRHGLTDRFVVLYAGNMGPAQGLESIVDAAALLRDLGGLTIALVGGGTHYEALQESIRAQGLANVMMMLPHQPYAEVPRIYGAADVCLVTLARGAGAEAIPSKVYRIMACGRPIIAAADPESDLAALVQDARCGSVVPAGDATALAAAMRDAHARPDEWHAMGTRGRAYVERHYARGATSAKYDALIRTVARA